MTLKERVHYLLDPGDEYGKGIDAAILTLIFLNILALVLETMPPVYALAPRAFEVFEDFSLTIFCAEYLLRLWSCTAMPRFSGAFAGRLRFALTPLALIDLAAILPFLLPLLGADMRFVRVVRLLRFARIFKLVRYSRALRLLGRVVFGRKEELISIFFVLLILLVIASSLMYLAEHQAQPQVFSSIPAAMWWGIITLTTVGYGDTYPVTGAGRFIAACIAVLGIGMFALPAGILGAGFVEELQKNKEENKELRRCPHCGEIIEE
jgi:voltage-gated potassium channel